MLPGLTRRQNQQLVNFFWVIPAISLIALQNTWLYM